MLQSAVGLRMDWIGLDNPAYPIHRHPDPHPYPYIHGYPWMRWMIT
jgi:hypothetical protein